MFDLIPALTVSARPFLADTLETLAHIHANGFPAGRETLYLSLGMKSPSGGSYV